MATPTAQEAFMSFLLLIGAGLGVLLIVGVVVAIVIVASASRRREEDR